MKKEGYAATATFIGTVIGAGILGIPYVFAKAGFLLGAISLIVLTITMLFLHLMLGEIALSTKGDHQITGYAKKYLGVFWGRVMLLTLVLGLYGALLAYIIGEGQALSKILGLNPFPISIIFFIIFSILIYFGINLIKFSELALVLVMISIILVISLISFNKITLTNFSTISIKNILIPYGVLLFACSGSIAVPEMKEALRDKSFLKKSIFLGTLIVFLIYLLFSFIVVGVSGANTSEIATISLGKDLGSSMMLLGNLFAVFAMATSFLTIGLAMREIYLYDYKKSKFMSWLLAVAPPLILFLLGFKDFIKTIGTTGALAIGTEGIMIVTIAWKCRKNPEKNPSYKVPFLKPIGVFLIIIFTIGLILTVKELLI